MEEASQDHLSSNPFDTSYHKGWAGKADWNSIREAFVWFSPLFALQLYAYIQTD